MAKASEADRLVELEREVADLKQRVELLELFVDSEHRERMGTTLDEVRATWRESRAVNVTDRCERSLTRLRGRDLISCFAAAVKTRNPATPIELFDPIPRLMPTGVLLLNYR
jgi:hypothetical protein